LDNAVLNVDSVVMSIKARPFIQKKLPKQKWFLRVSNFLEMLRKSLICW
jgi:hypothetical protein